MLLELPYASFVALFREASRKDRGDGSRRPPSFSRSVRLWLVRRFRRSRRRSEGPKYSRCRCRPCRQRTMRQRGQGHLVAVGGARDAASQIDARRRKAASPQPGRRKERRGQDAPLVSDPRRAECAPPVRPASPARSAGSPEAPEPAPDVGGHLCRRVGTDLPAVGTDLPAVGTGLPALRSGVPWKKILLPRPRSLGSPPRRHPGFLRGALAEPRRRP